MLKNVCRCLARANNGSTTAVQKRPARVVLREGFEGFEVSSNDMFSRRGWMPIQIRFQFGRAVMMYTSMHYKQTFKKIFFIFIKTSPILNGFKHTLKALLSAKDL